MQAGTGVRPHFSCTVCHNQFDRLYEFKNHLESQEHELAYGIRLRNSMVGSYFCNCCHICVNTLLIWKSHIMGTKHMKIACAFSMAYSNFDFDKPAKIKDVGVLDQNVVVPDSIQRSNGRPSALVRPLDPDTVVIGVTDMEYTGPGLYHCNLCNDPFNEGNKAQHLCSTRHRCNVFKRWDMALYDEAMSVKEVGKPEYTARCESIASEIFPVEQQVLSSDKKLLYERLMGTSQVLDDQYYAEELARGGPGPKVDNRQNAYDSQGPRGSRTHDRQFQQDRYGPPDDHPSRSRYHDNQYPRDEYGQGQRDGGRQWGGKGKHGKGAPEQEDQFNPRFQGRYSDNPRGRNNPPPQPPRQVSVDTDIKCDLAMESVRVLLQNLNVFVSETRSTPFTRVEILKAQILYEEVLKMAYPDTQKARADENYITVFHNGRLTLKRKEEPVKKPAPPVEVKKGEAAAAVEPQPPEPPLPAEEPSTSGGRPNRSSSKERRPSDRSSSKERRLSDRSLSKDRRPSDRSFSKDSSDRRPPPHSGPPGPHGVPPIPHQSRAPMFDPWGRPIMMHPGDVHRMPFYPPPDYYGHGGYPRPGEAPRDRPGGYPRPDEAPRDRPGGYPRPDEAPRDRPGGYPRPDEAPRDRPGGYLRSDEAPRDRPGGYPRPDEVPRDSRDRPVSPRRISPPLSTRKRTPQPSMESSRDQKKPRSKTPERIITLKEGSPVKSRPKSKSPRRTSESMRSPGRKSPGRRSPGRKSPGRRSPGRRSPRKSPSRSSRRSPSRRSPGRKSSSRRQSSPRRRSPSRKSRSPSRRGRSPPPKRSGEKREDGDGTLFLDEGAYAELLESLG